MCGEYISRSALWSVSPGQAQGMGGGHKELPPAPIARDHRAYIGLQSFEVLTDMSSAMIRPYMPSADAVPWMSTMPT